MIDDQLQRFRQSVTRFAERIEKLTPEEYLRKRDAWSPRDVVAHLVGWNRAVIEGCEQLSKGELPWYDIDPGADYSKVNAKFLRQHPSRDRAELLAELSDSAAELQQFLGSLDESTWAGDSGVEHGGAMLTVRDTVDELIADYHHHRRQIEGWLTGPGMSLLRTRTKVLEIVRRLWPDRDPAMILRLLDRYLGTTDEGRARVQLGVLKLSEGRTDRLPALVDLAIEDYRDVLASAEYPNEMTISPLELARLRREQIEEVRRADRRQYLEWLGATPESMDG